MNHLVILNLFWIVDMSTPVDSGDHEQFSSFYKLNRLHRFTYILFHPLRTMSKCSLFLYLFHWTLITWIYTTFIGYVELWYFILEACTLHLVCIPMAYLVAFIKHKKRKKRMPYLVKFYFGS